MGKIKHVAVKNRLVLVLTRVLQKAQRIILQFSVLQVIVLQGSGGALCTWLCCVVTFSYSDRLLRRVLMSFSVFFLFLTLEALPVMCRVPGDLTEL